jgi:NADH dehydrogenase [ubiquinone] 1 alpha subcomplex assembly factor 3
MPPPTPSPAALRLLRTLAFPSSHAFRTRTAASALNSTRCKISSKSYTTTTPCLSPPPVNKPTRNPRAPSHADRGPKSTEDTQTDFTAMDIFNSSSTPQPANSIDACTPTGFHLSNGTKTTGSKGIMLVGGEAFDWSPWATSSTEGGPLLDKRGLLHLPPSTLAVLAHLYPRPDLLVLGTGDKLHPLHPSTREYCMSELGVRVDVMDTANASATYNLLARERGLEAGGVGAALFPISWRG